MKAIISLICAITVTMFFVACNRSEKQKEVKSTVQDTFDVIHNNEKEEVIITPEQFEIKTIFQADSINASIFGDTEGYIELSNTKHQIALYNRVNVNIIKCFDSIFPNTNYNTKQKATIMWNKIDDFLERCDMMDRNKDRPSTWYAAWYLGKLYCNTLRYKIIYETQNICQYTDSLDKEIAAWKKFYNTIDSIFNDFSDISYWHGSAGTAIMGELKTQLLENRLKNIRRMRKIYAHSDVSDTVNTHLYILNTQTKFNKDLDKIISIVIKRFKDNSNFTPKDYKYKQVINKLYKEKQTLSQALDNYIEARNIYTNANPAIMKSTTKFIDDISESMIYCISL